MVVSRALMFIAIFAISASTVSAGAFGLTYAQQGFACITGACAESPGFADFGVGTTNLQQMTFTGGFDIVLGSARSVFTGSISNGELHGYAESTVMQGGPSAYSAGDLFWFDTFTFSPGVYDIQLNFSGAVTSTADPAYHRTDQVDTFQLMYDPIVIPGQSYVGAIATLAPGESTTVQKTFLVETEVVLGGLMIMRNSLGHQSSLSNSPAASVVMDNSQTGSFTVTPVTPDASFKTASGLNYAAQSVPEPASVLLLGLGVAGAVARFRRTT